MKIFASILFLLLSFVSEGQVEGGDVDALDFRTQIRKILCSVDHSKYKAIDFDCRVENKKNKSSSNTRLFYYFSSDSTVECLQIENDSKYFSRILRNSFRIIGTIFYPIGGSSYYRVDSIRETKIDGLKSFLVFRKGRNQLLQRDTLIINKSFVLSINRENGVLRDSSIYYSNGESITDRIWDSRRINCGADTNNHSMIAAQTHTTTILSIDTSKTEGNKFLLSETEEYTQEELTCATGNNHTWTNKCTWQCELNKDGLIEKMEILSDEGHRLWNGKDRDRDNQLIMIVNYSNEMQKEFCKYVTTLKEE